MEPRITRDLAHVLWLGGSPCAGKSTIAGILAARYGLRAYHCDGALARHVEQLVPERQPTLHKWNHTPWDELWMRPVEVLLQEALACYTEHFGLILDDLLSLPGSELILAEATALLPTCVSELLAHHSQAIWVIPTAVFQRAHYPERGPWVQQILAQCRDPQQALQNWMDRDVAFAGWVAEQAEALHLASLEVDGTRTIAENAQLVAEHFCLA